MRRVFCFSQGPPIRFDNVRRLQLVRAARDFDSFRRRLLREPVRELGGARMTRGTRGELCLEPGNLPQSFGDPGDPDIRAVVGRLFHSEHLRHMVPRAVVGLDQQSGGDSQV